jgi:hypothetical protein
VAFLLFDIQLFPDAWGETKPYPYFGFIRTSIEGSIARQAKEDFLIEIGVIEIEVD